MLQASIKRGEGVQREVMGYNRVLPPPRRPHVCLWLEPYHLKKAIAPPAVTHTPGFCTSVNK